MTRIWFTITIWKSFVDDEIIERRLRSAKLDLALGRTSFPGQEGQSQSKNTEIPWRDCLFFIEEC